MKIKKLSISLLALLVLGLTACGGGSSNPTTQNPQTTTATTKQEDLVEVSFSNTSMSTQKLIKGSKLEKPADPTKTNYIFGGWYLDSGLENEAVFPLTINENTTLYARFYSLTEALVEARDKTIGTNVDFFEFDYNLDAQATATVYGVSKTLTGTTTGNAKYNKNNSVSYYENNTSSGLLFFDGSKYQIKEGNNLQKVSVDKNDLIRDYEVEEVDSSYRFDSSSFAKAIFEFDASKIKSVTKTTKANEYKIVTSMTISEGVKLVGKYVNSSMVESIIGTLPETNIDTGMYVTFSGGKLSNYRYEMNIDVSSIKFSLIYKINFEDIKTAPTITPRAFSGISLTKAQISETKTEVNNILNTYMAKAHSGYNFTFKMGVDFLSKSEINATFKGSTKRKVTSNDVYFHNDIEIDSDFKNADLYKDAGISDVHIKKTKLSNGDVYNIEKKALADKTYKLDNYVKNDTDSYFLLKAFTSISNFTYIQKTTVEKSGETLYTFGLAKADVASLLNFFNKELSLDPLGTATKEAKLFGTFDASTIEPKKIEFTITLTGGILSSIEITSEGKYKTKYENSKEFQALLEATYDFSYLIEFTSDGDNFEPYETVNKAK